MAKIRLLSVRKIALKANGFSCVIPPDVGFSVVISADKTHAHLVEDRETRKALEAAAADSYNKYLLQTAKQLQKCDRFLAGLLKKGAAPAEVAKQAAALKKALEKEVPKWEATAAREAMALLKNLAKKKR